MVLVPILMGIAALGLTACGGNTEIAHGAIPDPNQGGGSGDSGDAAGRAGQGGDSGSPAPVCFTKNPQIPFEVSLNENNQESNAGADFPGVNDQGTFVFSTPSSNFFPPGPWGDNRLPTSQILAKNFAQAKPQWVSSSAENNPQFTSGDYPKIAGDLVVFSGDPAVFGFDLTQEGNLQKASILYRLSDGLRVWAGSDPTLQGSKYPRWLLANDVAERPAGQGHRIVYQQILLPLSSDTLAVDAQIILNDIDPNLQVGKSQWVSIDPNGKPGQGYSVIPKLSPNGRYLAFWSKAALDPNSPPPDTKSYFLYLRDLETNQIQRIPISQGLVLMDPSASNMLDGDDGIQMVDNAGNVVFRVELSAPKATYLYSASTQSVSPVTFPNPEKVIYAAQSLSADGKYLLYQGFDSTAPQGRDRFLALRNLATGMDYFLSHQPLWVNPPRISPDGRWVTWESVADKAAVQVYGMEICDETQLEPYK